MLIVACTTAMVAIVDVLHVNAHLALPRYLIATGPAVFALITAGAQTTSRSVQRAIAVIGVAACAIALPFCNPLWHGEWAATADFIHQRAANDDLIVFAAVTPRDVTPGWLYLGVRHYLPGRIPPV